MKKNCYIRIFIMIGLVAFFIVLVVVLMASAYNSKTADKETIVEDYNYNFYHISETFKYEQHCICKEPFIYNSINLEKMLNTKGPTLSFNGLIDSPWPMYCHDVRHTGRSPYTTVNTWDEIWCFRTSGPAFSLVIDNDGIIYVGGRELYAVYPNGTLKWKYDVPYHIEDAPAIDENGIIYFGTIWADPNYLYALYPNGTLKWKYSVGGVYDIFSSPAIDDDGTIYFGSGGDYPPTGSIKALYPNGTLKWKYNTNHVVYSSPAIGLDGTIYCGCHDTYLYALYPNNGTLKWKYKTGDWIRVSPCIADDGTIYVVSLDSYLHAVNADGSLKWKTDVGAGTSPTIGQDGTIYAGYSKLYAVNPINGSVKWTFDVGGTMCGGTPCNSVDGTIYIGTSDGGEIIAINSDGTLKWRKSIGTCESAPAIGEDGVVYIGSYSEECLYAFGIGSLEAEADGPRYGLIHQPVQFIGSATGGYRPYTWKWNFGDGQTSNVQNPSHTYINPGNYTITLTVTDNSGNTSSDTTWAKIKQSNKPPNKPSISGPTHGEAGIYYDYTFVTTDPDNDEYLYYYVDWGDNSNTGWIGPYIPGKDVTKSHRWLTMGIYTIKAKARDNYDAESDWGTLKVTMPVNTQSNQQVNMQLSNSLLFKIVQRLLNNR